MRRAWLAFSILCGFVLSPVPARASTIVVDCRAGDSLSAAVAAGGGGVVPVFELHGTCEERVTLDYPMVLVGGNPDAGIEGAGIGNVVTIAGDGVVIRDLVISGGARGPGLESGHGIYVPGPYFFDLVDTVIQDNERSGIFTIDAYGTATGLLVRRNGGDGASIFGACCGSFVVSDSRFAHNAMAGISGDEDQAIVVSDTVVAKNGEGIFAYEYLHLEHSIVRRNSGSGVGSTGRADIVSSRINHNGGGGLTSVRVVVDSRIANNGGYGVDEAATVLRSAIVGNDGPGLLCYDCVVEDTSIRDNRGSGIVVEMHGEISRSLVAENRSPGGDAAAVQVASGALAAMSNSTLARNRSETGAAVSVLGSLTLSHVSAIGNRAPDGFLRNSGTTEIFGSIVARHHLSGSNHCRGTAIVSIGWNVVRAPGCAWDPTDIRQSPRLGPLQDNGGPTETYRLLPDSPAVDLIPPAECVTSVDQRGAPRPVGDGCDSGAYERGGTVSRLAGDVSDFAR